eukprot:CAMPEP_0202896536 /NCGR_PEP_ID=MMETSP1392-20130828/5528_1 /ASSEMBLY_ACC=CAM_ASM_000868 /TAXON_ID=225041 /ORGANISM="Chlamydomonas chlamydogama, Strain SAG 11-48b" /LENGTH=50 /DNA_ID=CAMNT_0049581933 /DNA_START=170 /DNA_END=322 /DNA_ORIENTATION=-
MTLTGHLKHCPSQGMGMTLGLCYNSPDVDEGLRGHEAQRGGSVVGLQGGE